MKIELKPQRSDSMLTLHKENDILTINGDIFDFSSLPDGAILPRYTYIDDDVVKNIECDFIISDVKRVNGELELTLRLPHGPNASEAARFPEPIIDPADGEVELPK